MISKKWVTRLKNSYYKENRIRLDLLSLLIIIIIATYLQSNHVNALQNFFFSPPIPQIKFWPRHRSDLITLILSNIFLNFYISYKNKKWISTYYMIYSVMIWTDIDYRANLWTHALKLCPTVHYHLVHITIIILWLDGHYRFWMIS